MTDRQQCFEIKDQDKNFRIEHDVFNLIYLIELFNLFCSEEFYRKRGNKGRPVKYSLKELLTFYFWGKNNNRVSISPT